MKKIFTLILFAAIVTITFAQTVLKPGDIAIVQVNFSQNSFDFVPLVDIAAGTKISFTDYAWKNSLGDFDKTTQYDAIITYTAPSNIAKGTVIQSKNNTAFDYSSISFNSKTASNYYLKGENIIAFQKNVNDTTFLTAFGWMRKNNFAVNPYNSLAKVCDIPPGLSKEYFTVIQMDSVVWGQNSTLQRDFRYNKYDGYTGNPSQIRHWTSITSNYDTFSGSFNNNAVPDFTVLAPDITSPELLYSYPKDNKTNVLKYRDGVFEFDEEVIVRKPIILAENGVGNIKTFTPADFTIQNDTVLFYNLFDYLEKNKTYTLSIPAGFVTDYAGNEWPQSPLVYNFAVSNKNTVNLSFGSPFGSGISLITEVCPDCAQTSDITYTTTKREQVFEENYWSGSIDWKMDGIPVHFYMPDMVTVANSNDLPEFPSNAIPLVGQYKRFVIDMSQKNQTITALWSEVEDNNSKIEQLVYSGNQLISKKSFSGIGGRLEGKLIFENETNLKVDSIVYWGYESYLKWVSLEVVDQAIPVVELGNTKTICEGDSVVLDAGITLGALYNWSNGDKKHSTTVKTSGNYSVTVSNSLGSATDNVQVIVKPVITLSMPDTIYACVGDTVTLVAGTNTENSYFWSPGGQTTPTIKVTKSGIYHVLVNNGFGGCFSTDSTRVIFKGAKARIYNYQGGSYGSGDVKGQLYRKNATDKFELYREMDMLDFVQFDSLAAGNYIFKMHFVNYSFVGENPWMDTYHDGKTEWKKVTPFKLSCETDTMIGFLIANKPSFVFNGTGVISGKVNITGQPVGSPMYRAKAGAIVDCNTRVVLYNATGDIIATTCPDANGNYSFTNLPAGNYTVGIERTGFEMQSVFTTTVAEGTTISNADFTINQSEQTVIQGITTGVSNAVIGNLLNLKLLPNPAVNTTMLEFDLAADSNVTISVSDLTGRVIQKDIRMLATGKNRIPLAVDNLSGIYFVKVSTLAGYSVARLIVQ